MASYVLSKVGGVRAKSDPAVRSVVGGFLFLCLVANVDKAAKGAQGDDNGEPEDEKRGPAEGGERLLISRLSVEQRKTQSNKEKDHECSLASCNRTDRLAGYNA